MTLYLLKVGMECSLGGARAGGGGGGGGGGGDSRANVSAMDITHLLVDVVAGQEPVPFEIFGILAVLCHDDHAIHREFLAPKRHRIADRIEDRNA